MGQKLISVVGRTRTHNLLIEIQVFYHWIIADPKNLIYGFSVIDK